MSATFPSQDDLRIPPKPRAIRPAGPATQAALPVQLIVSAGAGFGLAWLLSRLIIG